MIVRVELSTMFGCKVISGDDVCCSVVLGTLVGVFVFSVMWSELLACAFTSPWRTECGIFVMYCMQCCMSVSAVL